jgi:hypothetical protein
MPLVSEKQRRAMYAAAAGRSTLGIPRVVGREFVAADRGGKPPLRKKLPPKARSRASSTRYGRGGGMLGGLSRA